MNPTIEKEFLKKITESLVNLQQTTQYQLTTSLFADPINKKLFEIVLWFYQKYNNVISSDSLKIILSKSKMDESTQQKVLLLYTEIQSSTFENRPLTFLVDQLKETYKKAVLKEVLITSVSNFESSKVQEAVDILKSGITKIELNSRSDIKEGFIHESAEDRWTRYLDIKNNPEKYRGIPIGFPSFDRTTNGIRNGQLMVIIASVKEGKSTALLNMAYHATITGYNVLYVSVEMPKDQIERRYDARDSQLSYSKIRDGRLSPEEQRIYRKCLDDQKTRPGKMYVIDAHECSTSFIKSKIATFPHKFDLVVIDYLSIVKSANSGHKELWQTIGDIAYEIRDIARELNIPIITAAQANREGMKESKYKYGVENVGLSHLISAHADTLLSLRLVDRDELEVNDVVEMSAATIAIRDDRACRFTIDACFDKMTMTEREMIIKSSPDIPTTTAIPEVAVSADK